MPRVIPSGTTDYTTQIAMREAAANDALARLYISLAARREDRRAQQDFQEYMLGLRQQQQERLLDRNWDRQRDLIDYRDQVTRRGVQDNPNNPLSRGGAGTPTTAPTTPRTAPAAPQVPGGQFGPDTGGFKPQSTKPLTTDKFSQADTDATQAFAQADEGDTDLPRGAQPVQYQKQPSVRPARKYGETGTQLPRTPTTARGQANLAARQAAFVDIHPDIRASWAAAEKANGLPQGTLQVIMGVENGGGRQYGQNPNSTAHGFFQPTQEFRNDWGLSLQDTLDPVKMGNVVAQSLRRSNEQLKKISGGKVSLGTNVQDIPHYAILHNYGVGDGPRLVYQQKVNGDVRAADVMLGGPDAAGRRLSLNHLDPNETVAGLFAKRGAAVTPYINATIQDQAKPPRPPADVGGGDSGGGQQSNVEDYLISRGVKPGRVAQLNPEMRDRIAHVMQKAEDATGSRMSVSSSYRSPEEQAQIYADMKGRRVHYGGNIYTPTPGKRSSGMVALPGQSRHGKGEALDFNESPGRDWLRHTPEGRQVLRSVGLEALRGDEPHIQLARGPLPTMATGVRVADASSAVPTPTPSAPTAPLKPIEAYPGIAKASPNAAPNVPFMTNVGASKDVAALNPYFGQPTFPQRDAVTASTPTPPVDKPKAAPAVPAESSAASAAPTPQVTATPQTPSQYQPPVGDQYAPFGEEKPLIPDTEVPPEMPPPPNTEAYGGDPADVLGALSTLQPISTGMVSALGGDPATAQKNLEAVQDYNKSSLVKPPISVGSLLSSDMPQQASDEAGMIESAPYAVPEAQPGEGTNAIIQKIQQMADSYKNRTPTPVQPPKPDIPPATQAQPEERKSLIERIMSSLPSSEGATYTPENIKQIASAIYGKVSDFNTRPEGPDPVRQFATDIASKYGGVKVPEWFPNMPTSATGLRERAIADKQAAWQAFMNYFNRGSNKSDAAAQAKGDTSPIKPKVIRTLTPGGQPWLIDQPPLNPIPKGAIVAPLPTIQGGRVPDPNAPGQFLYPDPNATPQEQP